MLSGDPKLRSRTADLDMAIVRCCRDGKVRLISQVGKAHNIAANFKLSITVTQQDHLVLHLRCSELDSLVENNQYADVSIIANCHFILFLAQ